MINFIKQMMGITSSDNPNENNQNSEDVQEVENHDEYPDEYWEMLEEEWANFMLDVDQEEIDALMSYEEPENTTINHIDDVHFEDGWWKV
jgi:hypothetical protein